MKKIGQLINKSLPAGSFAKNVVTLMTGTTFAQALLILVAPILTRLYSPDDFGVYALYTSVASIITVFACLSYDYAIVLPKKDDEAANVLGLSILICLGISGLTLILVALFRIQLAIFLNAPNLAVCLWFIPLSVLGAGLYKAFNYWSTRRNQFKRLAVRQITQSAITSATQIGMGITSSIGPGGLISGLIIGQLAATGRLTWQIGKDEGGFIKSCISYKSLKRIAIRYKKFPLYDSWSGLFNTGSTMLPALLLGYFFSPAVVGFYALGQRVLSLPMGVIGSSIAQVFYPRAAKADREGDLSKVTLDMFERLLAIGFVPLMLIAVVAPDLFALVFGERWWTAGEYVRWMSLWLFFQFVSSPLSTLYYVMGRQSNLLTFNVIMFVTRLLVIIVGGLRGDVLLTIIFMGITGTVLYALLCMHITKVAGIHFAKILLVIFKRVMYSVPYGLFPLTVWYVSSSSFAFVSAAVASGCIFLVKEVYHMNKSGLLI